MVPAAAGLQVGAAFCSVGTAAERNRSLLRLHTWEHGSLFILVCTYMYIFCGREAKRKGYEGVSGVPSHASLRAGGRRGVAAGSNREQGEIHLRARNSETERDVRPYQSKSAAPDVSGGPFRRSVWFVWLFLVSDTKHGSVCGALRAGRWAPAAQRRQRSNGI